VRRRTWAGLPGFVAIEAGVFCRYTNIVVLGCAVLAVLAAWRLPGTRLPAAALGWWLGSVAVFGAGVAIFDDLAYGGPLRTGYPAGLITFSLGAVLVARRKAEDPVVEVGIPTRRYDHAASSGVTRAGPTGPWRRRCPATPFQTCGVSGGLVQQPPSPGSVHAGYYPHAQGDAPPGRPARVR